MDGFHCEPALGTCDGFATLERNNFGGLNETAAPRFGLGRKEPREGSFNRGEGSF
jgi:hypothetical protein